MGTAISRTGALIAAALAIAASGCGSAGPTNPSAFAWLRPAPAPAGWPSVRIQTGAILRYPRGWKPIRGDAGTATAALQNAQREFLGYLNLTPRQADESLRTWASFRTRHNAEEGDRDVTELAAATGLRFRNGRGSCVRDSYTTDTGNRFVELACLVQGRRRASVIVGAAPPEMWAATSPLVERAISAFTT